MELYYHPRELPLYTVQTHALYLNSRIGIILIIIIIVTLDVRCVIDEFKQLANVNSCLFVFAYVNQMLSYNIIIIARDHIVMRGITVKTV